MEEKNIRVAFYIRVSTDEQAKDGYGLPMQLRGLEDMMEYRGKFHNWVHEKEWLYVDDGYSGSDLNRPEYKRLMKDIKAKKYDMVAVWKIDRLSRNLSHLLATFESLQWDKVGFFSLKENIDFSGPIGKLTFQIFWALAEFERETIKMRTREGKIASARMGNYVINAAPYGYEKVQKTGKTGKWLRIVPEEAEWVKRIFAECNSWTSREWIAKIMNESKVLKGVWSVRDAKTTKWHGTTIMDILSNSTYTWNAIFKPKNDKWEVEEIEIPVPPIISPLDFELAQKFLEDASENAKRGGGKTEYLLSRKVMDIETGRKFIGVTRDKDKRHNYRRKAFTLNGKRYDNKDIPWEALDDYVWSFIQKAIQRPEALFEAYKKQNIDNTNYAWLMDQRRKTDIKLKEIQNIEFTIEKLHLSGKYSEEMRDKLIEDNQAEICATQKRINELDAQLDSILKAEATREALEAFSANLSTNIDNLTFAQKKTLVNILIEKVEVTYVKSQANAKVTMRFAHSLVNEKMTGYEPKKLSANSKTDSEELENGTYGATSRARTCDLLLRREAL